jgi:hypothetical protein
MDVELYQTITLRSRSFNVLQAPLELFIKALNQNLNLQRFKGSISNYSAVINELKDRKENIQKNIDYIKENYLKLSNNDALYIEYVIAVPNNDAVEMLNRIIEAGGDLIVWQVAITGNPEISIAFPHKNISSIPRQSMMHRDQQLNRALDIANHTQSNRNAFNIFPQGHPFIKPA